MVYDGRKPSKADSVQTDILERGLSDEVHVSSNNFTSKG